MYSKRERPSHFSVYRDAAFLSNCSEGEAREWLKGRSVDFSSVFGTPETPPDSHALEYILFRRKSPLIDLALAEYGRSGSVLARVYRRGNTATRIVACGNPLLFVGEKIYCPPISFDEDAPRVDDDGPLSWKIVRDGPLAELRAVCENPHLRSGFYAGLASSWEGDEDSQVAPRNRLSADRFKRALLFLSRNPRISTPREDSKERHYWDGFADYSYNKFFAKCWELAKVVPTDLEWAHVLSKLYAQLHRPYKVFDDVESVLSRWRPQDEKKFASTVSIREEIAAKFLEPTLETLNSEDPAIRHAFYRTFDPENSVFRDLKWAEWLERDDMCYFYLDRNLNIWRSSRGRAKLEALLWNKSRHDHDVSDVGFFKGREEEYRKTNPEWFIDEEEPQFVEGEELQHDRIGDLGRLIRELIVVFERRRNADAILFLVAALVGSFIGTTIF